MKLEFDNLDDKKNNKDLCVVCVKETPFDKNEHIDFRMGYVEGCGQLCLECWDKIYYKPMVESKYKEVSNDNI